MLYPTQFLFLCLSHLPLISDFTLTFCVICLLWLHLLLLSSIAMSINYLWWFNIWLFLLLHLLLILQLSSCFFIIKFTVSRTILHIVSLIKRVISILLFFIIISHISHFIYFIFLVVHLTHLTLSFHLFALISGNLSLLCWIIFRKLPCLCVLLLMTLTISLLNLLLIILCITCLNSHLNLNKFELLCYVIY